MDDELTGQIVFNDLTLNAISMYEQEVRFAPFLQKAVSFTPTELGQIVSTLFDSRIDFFGKTESKTSPSPVMLERRLSLLEMSVSLGHIMVFLIIFNKIKLLF